MAPTLGSVLLFAAAMSLQSLAAPEAEVVAALALDDQCGANGGDCALNALQVRSATLAREATEEQASEEQAPKKGILSALNVMTEAVHANVANATEEISCTSGMVAKIRAFSPSCIDGCPQICEPLAKAWTAYETKGGQSAMMPVLCSHMEQYACAITGNQIAACKKLIDKAAAFGARLPRSTWSLHELCR
mmetsp:Transcript_95379/g.194073  ORF Transcript_95379/g.194073 Transcript_95379/m.194073 type:complete len:191 (-) Transcript_95379:86-658(-)